jgi:hypothetical protein
MCFEEADIPITTLSWLFTRMAEERETEKVCERETDSSCPHSLAVVLVESY